MEKKEKKIEGSNIYERREEKRVPLLVQLTLKSVTIKMKTTDF